MSRMPDQIMGDFDIATRGQADIDPREVLWEVIDDIRSSYRLAMEHALKGLGVDWPNLVDEVQDTVLSYVSDAYGDD